MKKFYGLLAAVSTLMAALFATSACWWFMYQPEEPASLKDK